MVRLFRLVVACGDQSGEVDALWLFVASDDKSHGVHGVGVKVIDSGCRCR